MKLNSTTKWGQTRAGDNITKTFGQLLEMFHTYNPRNYYRVISGENTTLPCLFRARTHTQIPVTTWNDKQVNFLKYNCVMVFFFLFLPKIRILVFLYLSFIHMTVIEAIQFLL